MSNVVARRQHIVHEAKFDPYEVITTKEIIMFNNMFTSARASAGRPVSNRIRLLALTLLVLVFAQVPAFADHIHYLYINGNTLTNQDLTVLTNGGIGTPYGAITSFRTPVDKQMHVYYVDQNTQHVHQTYTYGNNQWTDADMTGFTGGVPASPYSISGFAVGKNQYVFYVGNDSHMHLLFYNGVFWGDADITKAAGLVQAAWGPVLAFSSKPNNQFNAYYQDQNLHLHQLSTGNQGTTWVDIDITANTGAECYSQWIAGFAEGSAQNVYCPGLGTYSNNIDMLHLHTANGQWVYEDVTFNAGGSRPALNLGAGVAAEYAPGTNYQGAYSFTTDTHLQQYAHRPPYWVDSDLTAAIGAPGDGAYGGIVAFLAGPNNQNNVFYSPNSQMYLVESNDYGWYVILVASNVDPNSEIAGFGVGNSQNVFYMSNN